jgi:hypothetical protein
MSDVTPKRTAREPGRSGISQGEPAPVRTAPVVPPAMVPGTTVPEAPAVPAVVSAMPEAAAPLPAAMVSATADPLADSPESPDDSWHSWTAFAEAQAALARGFEAIAVEIAGKTRSGIAAASDAAIALLGARTFSEAIDINAGLARRGVDAVIEGSAKLSDIGVKAAGEASRPMLARLGGARSSALRPIISHAAAR